MSNSYNGQFGDVYFFKAARGLSAVVLSLSTNIHSIGMHLNSDFPL